jgi:hypothetical protein
MNNKKKRIRIEDDDIDNIISTIKYTKISQPDELEDIISTMKYAKIKSREEEYDILYDAYKHGKNLKPSDPRVSQFLDETTHRYTRYLHYINLDNYAKLKKMMENYIKLSDTSPTNRRLKLAQDIDSLLLNNIG